jgi:two-component system NtrC family sensor kinase
MPYRAHFAQSAAPDFISEHAEEQDMTAGARHAAHPDSAAAASDRDGEAAGGGDTGLAAPSGEYQGTVTSEVTSEVVRILIVDDSPSIHDDFREILASAGSHDIDPLERLIFGSAAPAPATRTFVIDSAYQGQQGVEMVERAVAAGMPYMLCFLDVRMPPGWDGPETLGHLWRVDPNLQVVLCTAYSDYSWSDIIARCGSTDRLLILKKPFEVPEVRQLAHALTEKWRLARANERRLADLEGLVAERTEALRREITERARAEHALLQVQRLNALGRLAAGIGHEINNPLTFILGSIEAVQEILADHEPRFTPATYDELSHLLGAALTGTDRIAQIVRSIKMFVRPEEAVSEAVDVAAAARLALDMVRRDVAPHIVIELALTGVPPVLGKRVELEQVFINLCKNAAQAMAGLRDREARLRVSSRCEQDQVIIEIADTGPGIAPKDLDKIFDPFFTTKPVGQGTGLGLSICHAIISSMSGAIDVRSTPQHGTVVTVRLPALDMPSPGPDASGKLHPAGSAAASSAAPGRARRGRILIVDDEPFVLQMMMHALRDHDILGMTSSRDAFARCMSEPFDLVLCDLMMPEISGMHLYQMIRQARPALAERIVFVTGGAMLDDVREFLEHVPNEYLEKPVDRRRLQAHVHELLDRWS